MMRSALLAVLLSLMATPCFAHDLWLIPPERIVPGKPALVRGNVGMDFPKSVHAIDPKLFKRRIVIGPDGEAGFLESGGIKDASGLLRFVPQKPGIHHVGVETQPKLITLPAEKFNEYLVADGLPHIYRLRAREKTLDQPGKERYRKSPTALIQVGKGGGDFARPLGLPLQIVPLHNPFLLKAGDALPVRVLFQGKPLGEANLGWQQPGDGDTARGTIRTNHKGEALVPIAAVGLMTIRLTYMTRPRMPDFEWESFWTTLTFRIPTE